MSYVIDGEKLLHDLGGVAVYYISDIHFELLDAGDTTKFIRGMIFFTWCIVKLNCYFTFFGACIILFVVNDIIHMGIKMISWIWVVCDVNTTSEFSDHI